MTTDVFQGRQMNVGLAVVYCERCGRRGQCVYIISHKPEFPYEHELKLCLERCWIELGNAVREHRAVYEESWDTAPAQPWEDS